MLFIWSHSSLCLGGLWDDLKQDFTPWNYSFGGKGGRGQGAISLSVLQALVPEKWHIKSQEVLKAFFKVEIFKACRVSKCLFQGHINAFEKI